MASRWPARPETLVRRFELAVCDLELMGAYPPEDWKRIEANYRTARANLLARITPVTDYQRRRTP